MKIILDHDENRGPLEIQQTISTNRPIYVRLCGGMTARTEEAVPGRVMVDYDENDQVLGVEILD